MSAPACWLLVTTPHNYARTRAHRFTVQGLKTRHRRKAERMAPGDRICWYLVGIGGFVATATVASPMFVDTKPIWVSTGAADPYPWRVRIRRDIVREARDAVPAAQLVERLAFVRRWPRPHWRLAFQGNVREIGRRDFSVIEKALAA